MRESWAVARPVRASTHSTRTLRAPAMRCAPPRSCRRLPRFSAHTRGLRRPGDAVGVAASGSPSSKTRGAILGSRGPSSSSRRDPHRRASTETAATRAVTRVADAHVQIQRAARRRRAPRARRTRRAESPPARTRARRPRRAPPWPRRAPRSTRLDAAARPAGPPARPRAGRERASRPTPSAREPGASSPAHPVPGPRRRGSVRASRGPALRAHWSAGAEPSALVERGDARRGKRS